MAQPASPPDGNSDPSTTRSLVKAETAIQLALVLPAAVVIGWAIGAGLDHWLHTTWIYLAGLGVGAIAGFTQTIRTAILLNKNT